MSDQEHFSSDPKPMGFGYEDEETEEKEEDKNINRDRQSHGDTVGRRVDSKSGDNCSCVIIGPSSTGKTWVFRSFYHAAIRLKHPRVQFTHLSKAAQDKLKTSILATTEIEDYDCVVNISQKPSSIFQKEKTLSAKLKIFDGPGEVLFPRYNETSYDNSTQASQIIKMGAKSNGLILCVDSQKTEPGLYISALPKIIGQMCDTHEIVPETANWFMKLKNRLFSSERETRRFCLGFDRVLILLTKIDLPAQRMSEITLVSPKEICERIEPFNMLRQYIGLAQIQNIHNTMKPGAHLAVGICSAFGFHPQSGTAFNNHDDPDLNYCEARLNDAEPYGVNEALLFILTGKVGETMTLVRPVDLA